MAKILIVADDNATDYGEDENGEPLTQEDFAKWTTKYKNSLPDSSFLLVKKPVRDKSGDRALPIKNKDGQFSRANVQTALTRVDKIKGFRSRGRLTDGVPLVEGISEIVAGAVEPDFENTLPWLNIENNNDRILASFIEIIRLHPHSPIILVTRDINLQNKAEFARLQFEEPPAP